MPAGGGASFTGALPRVFSWRRSWFVDFVIYLENTTNSVPDLNLLSYIFPSVNRPSSIAPFMDYTLSPIAPSFIALCFPLLPMRDHPGLGTQARTRLPLKKRSPCTGAPPQTTPSNLEAHRPDWHPGSSDTTKHLRPGRCGYSNHARSPKSPSSSGRQPSPREGRRERWRLTG